MKAPSQEQRDLFFLWSLESITVYLMCTNTLSFLRKPKRPKQIGRVEQMFQTEKWPTSFCADFTKWWSILTTSWTSTTHKWMSEALFQQARNIPDKVFKTNITLLDPPIFAEPISHAFKSYFTQSFCSSTQVVFDILWEGIPPTATYLKTPLMDV